MALYHWAGTCPLCRQGRLILQRNDSSRAIYAHCEECEQGFDQPADAAASKGFLTLSLDYDSSNPDLTEIMRSPWAGHVTGSFAV